MYSTSLALFFRTRSMCLSNFIRRQCSHLTTGRFPLRCIFGRMFTYLLLLLVVTAIFYITFVSSFISCNYMLSLCSQFIRRFFAGGAMVTLDPSPRFVPGRTMVTIDPNNLSRESNFDLYFFLKFSTNKESPLMNCM